MPHVRSCTIDNAEVLTHKFVYVLGRPLMTYGLTSALQQEYVVDIIRTLVTRTCKYVNATAINREENAYYPAVSKA